MELDLLAQPECFFCREVLVQGRELVCIEVVADKYDIVGIAVDLVYKPFDLLRPVGLGPRPGYLHVSPAPRGSVNMKELQVPHLMYSRSTFSV